MKYLLSFRERDRGGAVVPGRLVAGHELGRPESLRLETRVTLLIHGFNVNFDEGRTGLLALADSLPSLAGDALVAVLWPGDHWSGPLSYSFEGRDANDTARMLGRYLHDNLGQDAAISFIGHSLGCRVTLETIKRLDLFRRRARQVCLMAPAVDDDSLSGPAEYLAEVRNVDRVAVMSSRKDTVLKYAYPAGDLLQAFVFASETADMALGFHGPRAHRQSGTGVPGNVFDLRIPVDRGAGHGDYVPGSPANEKQRTAAAFADDVISGNAAPRYAF